VNATKGRHAKADRGMSGLTMVELLVTVVIAGIAFASLVPLFVQSAKASASDNVRVVALAVAQDKLERIRGLSYDGISVDNLNDGTFATAHGLGNHSSATTGEGTKDFLINYTVKYIYDPTTDYQQPGLELYKQVTVDVYWVGNPKPVKHTYLRTAIYRQYAGPAVYSLQVSPLSLDSRTLGMVVPGPDHIVTFSAYVESGVGVKEVDFTLKATNGAYTKRFEQTSGVNGVYVWTWDTTGAPDGFYTVTATAVSPGGGVGKTWPIVEQLETGPPPPPVALTASPENLCVTLDWQPPSAGDVSYYEIWRSTTAPSSETGTRSGDAVLLATDLSTFHYPDTSVTNDTTYYYWVYAIDLVGNIGIGASAYGTPSFTAGDHTAPTAPAGFSASGGSSSVTLTWVASLDPTPPDVPAGVAYYEIYRSEDGVNFSPLEQVDAPNVSWSDAVGAGSPWYWYEIRAVDASVNANRSTFVVLADPVQTGPASVHTLTVTNVRPAANQPCFVTVKDVVSKLYYDQSGHTSKAPVTVTIPSKSGNRQWSMLPVQNTYEVTATYSSGKPPYTSFQSVPGTPATWDISFR
jgi:type II secretory pathway pseudopilin PulG